MAAAPCLTPLGIPCHYCEQYVAHAGPLFDEAGRRREAYANCGKEPSPRDTLLGEKMTAHGWSSLRGRSARRASLLQEIDAEFGDSPRRYDLGYRRAQDTICIRELGLWTEEWVRHWCFLGPESPFQHSRALTGWALEDFEGHVMALFEKGGLPKGKRLAPAIVVASDRLIADRLGISWRTVRRRRHARVDWWASVPANRSARN